VRLQRDELAKTLKERELLLHSTDLLVGSFPTAEEMPHVNNKLIVLLEDCSVTSTFVSFRPEKKTPTLVFFDS
jgi:hypothetical protein